MSAENKSWAVTGRVRAGVPLDPRKNEVYNITPTTEEQQALFLKVQEVMEQGYSQGDFILRVTDEKTGKMIDAEDVLVNSVAGNVPFSRN